MTFRGLLIRGLFALSVMMLSGCITLGGGGANNRDNVQMESASPYEWPPFQQADNSDFALGPAPRALMAEADQHYASGAYDAAGAALERALRIAPRSPVLWYRLAGLRASEGDLAGANRLVEKANSLATSDTTPRVGFWLQSLSDWLLKQLR